MWVFLSGGMLMPALIPESVLRAAKTPDIQEAVERGWDLQVRGRVREHLEWFAEHYMADLPHSKVYTSNDKDYTTRLYCSKESYAEAMKRYILDMDYTKFKDTANKFPWGKKYHDLLIRVWSASANIFGAGGFYGPRSSSNPRGYGKAKERKRGNPRNHSFVGSTFFDDVDAPGGVDDLPIWATRAETPHVAGRKKSIHEMTDSELAAMDDGEFDDLVEDEFGSLTDDDLRAMWGKDL